LPRTGPEAMIPLMRTLLAATLATALLAALAPRAARADAPTPITLEVGETRKLGGYDGRCDDLSVVRINVGPGAELKALKPGKTTCSVAAGYLGGVRQVYAVTVVGKPAP